MTDRDFMLIVWTLASVTVVSLTLGLYALRTHHVERMAELERTALPQTNMQHTVWIRLGGPLARTGE